MYPNERAHRFLVVAWYNIRVVLFSLSPLYNPNVIKPNIVNESTHNKIFISWGEANGIGVSQILDFNGGKVYNHLLQDRKLENGHGTIRILK